MQYFLLYAITTDVSYGDGLEKLFREIHIER